MHTPSLQIMGHGLAGAILAECAHQQGFRVTVVHDNAPASSRVAAGLFTPVTGMKLNPTWLAEKILPSMLRFYPDLEKKTDTTFFHEVPTIRLLSHALDRDPDPQWFFDVEEKPLPFAAPHGAIGIRQSGWVDLNRMLDALETRRKALGQWSDTMGDTDLTVWAEGYRAAEHPLWWEAGWRNAHGDVLSLHIPGLREDYIFSFGKFLLPMGNQTFRCGATYDWGTKEPLPRDVGRKELEESLRSHLSLPFDVLDHQAGIRPVALSRVPILGPHPEDETQLIFNGFGSKGVLYAPYMAEQLLSWIRSGTVPEKEVWAPRRILRQRERRKHGHSDV